MLSEQIKFNHFTADFCLHGKKAGNVWNGFYRVGVNKVSCKFQNFPLADMGQRVSR